MSWAKLDDKFHSHPKVASAPCAAVGLFAKSISYCADYLTDGLVPYWWAQSQVTKREPADLIAQVVAAGLWTEVQDGYRISDYLDYNKSRDEVLAERRRNAEKMARQRRGGRAGGVPA